MENGVEGFKAGSVVRLLSGGPEMTIRFIDSPKGECGCEWFERTNHNGNNGYGELKEAVFQATSLENMRPGR